MRSLKLISTLFGALALSTAALPLQAQQDLELAALKQRIERLESRSEAVSGAKVGGYAELHYNAGEGQTSTWDLHRFVLLVEKQINPWIRFQSELELEHAFVEEGQGAIELEQAYLDFRLSPVASVKAGLMLLPLGKINQIHEPNTFYGVERPNVDKYIIPTTLVGEGVGLELKLGHSWALETQVVAGFDASGFRGKDALRGGRQKAFKSDATSAALVARLQYAAPGLSLGLSAYQGNAKTAQVSEDAAAAGVGLDSVPVGLFAVDGDYQTGPLGLRGLYAQGTIGNAGALNQVYGKAVGSALNGYYLEPSYKFWLSDEQALGLFLRYEAVNSQAAVATGEVDDSLNFTAHSVGLNYWPHEDVALKADYGSRQSLAEGAEAASFYNLGIGWVF